MQLYVFAIEEEYYVASNEDDAAYFYEETNGSPPPEDEEWFRYRGTDILTYTDEEGVEHAHSCEEWIDQNGEGYLGYGWKC